MNVSAPFIIRPIATTLLIVAVVLAGVGLRQGLPAGGEIRGELRAVAAIGAPGGEQSQNEATRNGNCSDAD